MIPPKKLTANPLNLKLFGQNNTNFNELKKSIEENGFLTNHPVLCYQKGKSLLIISGHRRWRAAIEIGIDQIPIIIISNVEDSEIERMMIEENLLRPLEGRQLSQIERYILALRLSAKFPERRGGDRRSADFIAKRSDIKLKDKDTWLSEKTGLCAKYISELNVITKKISEETSKAYPELLDGMPLYEQLQIIINQNLSADLSDLQAGTTTISALHKKYRTPKPIPVSNPQVNPQTSCLQGNHLNPEENVPSSINLPEHQDAETPFLNAFRDFLLAEFAENENISKAIQLLSLAPQGHIATLKSVQKVTILMLKTSTKAHAETKTGDIQSLPLFVKLANYDTGGVGDER